MGTYLSTPVVAKNQEEGECFKNPVRCAWGVVDMQGWRKSMEDAHVARTDIELLDIGGSTKTTAKVFGVFDGHGGPEVARFCAVYLVSVFVQQYRKNSNSEKITNNTGQALKETFHALDRMIDDTRRRDELVRLRAIAPEPGEQREVPWDDAAAAVAATPPTTHDASTKEKDAIQQHSVASNSKPPETAPSTTEKEEEKTAKSDNGAAAVSASSTEESESDDEDADSLESTGKDEAAENDQDLSSSDEEEEEDDKDVDAPPETPPTHSSSSSSSDSKAAKVSGMLQRLLNLKGSSGEVVLHVGQQNTTNAVVTNAANTKAVTASTAATTVIRNGSQILTCNLPDHPVHAGATAIVAVLIGRTLTVANAGDSRAVICRSNNTNNGAVLTHPLSMDHKPTQATEMSRIRTAGGFVNAFGRVNGNLNLSRSIGDLKYKQNRDLLPAQQMITAEPDITECVYRNTNLLI